MAVELSESQMGLCGTAIFTNRVAYVACQVATGVRAESTGTQYHTQRNALAVYVMASPTGWATATAPVIVGRPNVVSAGTSVGTDGLLRSNITDAALLSQITSDWNMLAGV